MATVNVTSYHRINDNKVRFYLDFDSIGIWVNYTNAGDYVDGTFTKDSPAQKLVNKAVFSYLLKLARV